MPTVNVVKPFTLQLDPPVLGTEPDTQKDPTGELKLMRNIYGQSDKIRFELGTYEVTEEIASHWYMKAHLAGYEPPPPAPGTHQFAQEALLAAQGVRMAQPVSMQGQAPAALPDDVRVASRSGTVAEGSHYFAGAPQEDKPLAPNTVMPPGEPRTETEDPALLGSKPPPRGGHHHKGG
jgi:hypothetical protein